jgi:hypothetical protein
MPGASNGSRPTGVSAKIVDPRRAEAKPRSIPQDVAAVEDTVPLPNFHRRFGLEFSGAQSPPREFRTGPRSAARTASRSIWRGRFAGVCAVKDWQTRSKSSYTTRRARLERKRNGEPKECRSGGRITSLYL